VACGVLTGSEPAELVHPQDAVLAKKYREFEDKGNNAQRFVKGYFMIYVTGMVLMYPSTIVMGDFAPAGVIVNLLFMIPTWMMLMHATKMVRGGRKLVFALTNFGVLIVGVVFFITRFYVVRYDSFRTTLLESGLPAAVVDLILLNVLTGIICPLIFRAWGVL